ncbi:lipopolysaccharide-induced tumor necrosis factor-alpha factor homolog [Leptopilina boulardi]|uniref:lipopolysaccharide-induced tumor necrosis factor-alpha factor homolog n=1 Tax=Leptopilina boulardi TaxID=63433 RepID=UPI0021F56931|nr:lipopolysaccharide-induced tumor necrosis factor-alpha factor homolog [Leptopilina boulardi]XP_051163238.1 lipopolysaccharide-induced tumor necrosis factor-alpha factor homolog [Leptopilina boulardi]
MSKAGPPPPGFHPPPSYNDANMPQLQPNVVIVGTPTRAFGPSSQPMTCPYCQANISTRVESESSTKTHLFALLLCIIGFWPCVPCPYCMDSCLTQKHFCPSCNAYLGQHEN